MAREYVVRTHEEKLTVVKRNLAGETCRALARKMTGTATVDLCSKA